MKVRTQAQAAVLAIICGCGDGTVVIPRAPQAGTSQVQTGHDAGAQTANPSGTLPTGTPVVSGSPTQVPVPARSQTPAQSGTPSTDPTPQAGPNSCTTLRAAAAHSGRYVGAALMSSQLQDGASATVIKGEFSMITPENEMKWDFLRPAQGQFSWDGADKLVAFADQNNMKMHGHNLMWYQAVPNWVNSLSASDLESELQNHIRTVMTRWGSKIALWDVVNEAVEDGNSGKIRSNSVWSKLGTDYVQKAFRIAQQVAEANNIETKLVYNDYATERVNAKSTAVLELAKSIRAAGIRIDGVGFQTHVGMEAANDDFAPAFAANIKRFSDEGFEIHLTEIDIRGCNTNGCEQTEAKAYANIVRVCMENPKCKTITTWGFTDGHTWLGGGEKPLLFTSGMQKKPAYESYLTELKKQ